MMNISVVQCSEDPCDIQRREVLCSVVGGACVQALKPVEERQCGNIICGNWTVGTWSEVRDSISKIEFDFICLIVLPFD